MTAVAVVDAPAMIGELSVTATEATPGRISSDASPVMLSLVAMIFADPGATLLTAPVVGSTLATARSLELQVMGRPVRMLLLVSRVTAVAVVDAPMIIVAGLSDTVTDVTAGITRRSAWPEIRSLVAMMLAVPGATAVTAPVVASTVATAALLELQVTGRPKSSASPASRVTTTAVVVLPVMRLSTVSVTLTEATCARTVREA
jgi:hypothetical protein